MIKGKVKLLTLKKIKVMCLQSKEIRHLPKEFLLWFRSSAGKAISIYPVSMPFQDRHFHRD